MNRKVTPSDGVLIAKTVKGDARAFRALYDRHVQMIRTRTRRLMGNGPAVDDVVQEIFIQLHRSLPRFKAGEPFAPWAMRITRNVTYSHLRRRPRAIHLAALQEFGASRSAWGQVSARQRMTILYAALDRVSDEAREVFILHTIEGLTLAEIANLTDTSINTVAARVRRTRALLKKVLERADQTSARLERSGA